MLSTILAVALSLTAAPIEAAPIMDNTSITSQVVGEKRGKVRIEHKRIGEKRGKVRINYKRIGEKRGKIRV